MSAALFARPRDIASASELLGSLGAGASIIAGGQELMPELNYHTFAPSVLVDIGGLKELQGIERTETGLSIGALCTHREIEREALVQRHAPLLAHSVTRVGGGWQVRNRGTIGGNIVSMHPLYDVLPALLAMRAGVTIVRNGETTDFALSDVMKSTDHGLGSEAILTRITIADAAVNAAWGYDKLKNTHGAYASATGAALVTLDEKGGIDELRVVVGSTEPLPRDVSDNLADLRGEIPDEGLLNTVAQRATDAIREPISDQRGDGGYRTAMAGVCARRAVEQAAARAAAASQTFTGGI